MRIVAARDVAPQSEWQRLAMIDSGAHTSAELHIGLEIPKDAAKKIQDWVKEQDWPEGTKLEDPKDYHITLVYTEDGYEDHAEDEWRHAEEGYDVEVTGIDLFGKEDEKATVLKIKSPEIVRHAEDVMDVAEERGIEINKFPGGYKPHITVAYGPGKPVGKAPKIEFHTGPSSVSEPREKTAVIGASDITEQVYQATINDGGITIKLDGTQPTGGYVFSPFKGLEDIVPLATLKPERIDSFIAEHKQQLAAPENYLGTWVSKSNVYIDVVQAEPDFNTAYRLAWNADQLSMWDVAKEVEIPVREGGQPPSELVSNFSHDASRLAVNLKQPQVCKFVYNIPGHHLIIGDMARVEGEVESHYDLMEKAGLEPKNNIYGQFSPNGRAVTFGRPRIEGFGKPEMNPKEAEYRTKQALEMSVPGARLEAFEPSHDKWNISGPPKVTYMREPPQLSGGEESNEANEWTFS